MSQTGVNDMETKATHYPPLIPGLAVKDAAKAIEFYKAAFGATELFRLNDPETGKVGHAELRVNGSLIMVADEYPAYNKSPATLGRVAWISSVCSGPSL